MMRLWGFAALAVLAAFALSAPQAAAAPMDSGARGKAITALWLRGRYFTDTIENRRWDAAGDKPFANTALEVGRLLGGSFISLGSAITDSLGVFDFRFQGGPGGVYYIWDSKAKALVYDFEWPTDATSSGQVIAVPPPKTSTKTKTTTKTRTTTKSATKAKTTTKSTTKAGTPTKTGTTTKRTSTSRTTPTTSTRWTSTRTTTTSGTTSTSTTTVFVCTVTPTIIPTALPLAIYPGALSGGHMVAADVDKDAIYFGGEHDEGITFGSDYLESTNGKLAAFIVKIDKAGVVQWTQFFNFSSYTYLYDLKVASDGSLWFTGQTGSSSFTLGSKTFSNGGGYDMFVGKIDTSTGVITYSLQIGTDASLPPSNTSPVLAPGGIAVADNNVKFIAGSYFDNTTFPDGKYVNCTNKDKGCCFMAKVTGTTFSWVSDFAGITAGTCGEAIGAKPDGSKVYAYAQNRIAEFDGTTGAVARTLSVSTPSLTWPQVHGMVVIGTDLFVAFTFETNITVGSVTVRGKAAVTTAIFKISLSSFTVTAGQNIANDFTADCRVRSMEPAYNSTTGALVLSMTTYDRVLQVNGTTVKTFATEVAIGYAIAITVLLSSDLQFVSGSALGGPEAGNLVEEMFEDDAAYAVSDPYNNGAVITVGMMTRTFYCSVYNGSIIGDDGAFFVTRYNATTLEQA